MPRHAERYHNKITEIDIETYNTLAEYALKNGYTPSLSELSKLLKISNGALYERINHLEKQGLIKYFGQGMKVLIRGIYYDGEPSIKNN